MAKISSSSISDEITENDILLVYVAFTRYMNHLEITRNNRYKDHLESIRCKQYRKNLETTRNNKARESILNDEVFWVNNRKITFKDRKEFVKGDMVEIVLLDLQYFQKICDNVEHFIALDNKNISKIFHTGHELQINFMSSDISNLPAVVHGCTVSLEKHLSLEEYLDWMPISLMDALFNILPKESLKWCMGLLLNYHYEEECGAFVSCALTFFLRTLDLSGYVYLIEARETIFTYLKFVISFKCDTKALVNALRIICVEEDTKNRFIMQPSLLKLVLERVQADNIVLPHAFKRYPHAAIKNIPECFVHEIDSFVVLLEYGIVDFCSENGFKLLIYKMPFPFFQDWNTLGNKRNTTFRCFQVIHLFVNHPHTNHLHEDKTKRALQLLWLSIPDPFLTEEDIMFCFKENTGTLLEERVWQWYNLSVAKGQSLGRAPRSLQNLTRCTIRNCLSSYFRCPKGIDSLRLPSKLMNYLKFKELKNY